jgi:hypothetical protein
MKPPRAHKLSQYHDGYLWVPFCSICSAEGDKLTISCSGGYKMVDKAKKNTKLNTLQSRNNKNVEF